MLRCGRKAARFTGFVDSDDIGAAKLESVYDPKLIPGESDEICISIELKSLDISDAKNFAEYLFERLESSELITLWSDGSELANHSTQLESIQFDGSTKEFIELVNGLLEGKKLPPITILDVPMNPNVTAIAGGEALDMAARRLATIEQIKYVFAQSITAYGAELGLVEPKDIDKVVELIDLKSTGDGKFKLSLAVYQRDDFCNVNRLIHKLDPTLSKDYYINPKTIEGLAELVNKVVGENYAIDASKLPQLPTKSNELSRN